MCETSLIGTVYLCFVSALPPSRVMFPSLRSWTVDKAQMMAVVYRSQSDIKWQELLNRITANFRWTEFSYQELLFTFQRQPAKVSGQVSIWSRKDICSLIRQIIALRHEITEAAPKIQNTPGHWLVSGQPLSRACHEGSWVVTLVTPNVKTQTGVEITELLIRLKLLDVIMLPVLRRLLVIDKMIRSQVMRSGHQCHEPCPDIQPSIQHSICD